MTNRVPWTTKEAPGTLVNPWASTKGAKGTTVVVAVVVVIMVVVLLMALDGLFHMSSGDT